MKRTVVIGLLFICTILNWKQGEAQMRGTLGIDGGISIGRTPTTGVNAGLEWNGFSIRTGFQMHLSTLVSNGVIFENRIGYTKEYGNFYITGQVGHAYVYRSSDQKGLNKSEALYIFENGYKWEFNGEDMATYFSLTKAGNYYIAGIGLRTWL